MFVVDFTVVRGVHWIKVSHGVREEAAEEVEHLITIHVREICGEFFPDIIFVLERFARST